VWVIPAQLAVTLLILTVCAFAPGFFFLRRLRWSPLEVLCGSVALSLLILWLAVWTLYVLLPGAWTAGSFAITLASCVLGALAWTDARKLFRAARVRSVIIAWAALLLWTLLILAAVRHFSGGTWFGDWLEHFQRTLVYLYHMPAGTEIFGGYRIPSRPPLAHIITAFIMAQTADRFEIYQLVFAFLTLLMFLPCCLLLPLVSRPWKFGVVPLTCLFALSPVIMVNATFPGTKPITPFFVVTALAFYLRGWKKNDCARITLAFGAAACGSLAHYSGIPYALFLGFHYLLVVFPHRKERWKELASITAAAAVPLLAWFGWCIAGFGPAGTFTAAAKASVVYGHAYEGGFFLKFILNLIDAIVPHLVRDPALVQAWGQPNVLGYIRDNAFPFYQMSLIFTMGLIGGPLIWWFFFRGLRRPGAERNFWLALVLCMVIANFALHGERDPFGVAHITLISMMALGLTFLAAKFTTRRSLALLVVAGCAIDFSLGVWLQIRIEHLENTPDPAVFARIQINGVHLDIAPAGPSTLARTSGGNWFRKHQYALAENWLRSIAATYPGNRGIPPMQARVQSVLTEVVRQDDELFGGWYKRHGGAFEFIGDHFGDSDWSIVLLAIGGIAILWKLARYGRWSLPATIPASVQPKVVRARKKA
jgi:hypothetical protein